MSIVVRAGADLTNWTGESKVALEYGEVSLGIFTLDMLLEGSEIEPAGCSMVSYTLSGDAAFKNDATDFIIISLGEDVTPGVLFLQQHVIKGDFLMLLGVGNKLKGFHCDKCANIFVTWFLESQAFWKEKHHASRSITETDAKATVH